jgi:5-methylthioadenosine/S-adenosylhomocysteine deaminase
MCADPPPARRRRYVGTDGASSNDTLRIFDVMRVAALVHGVSGPDYSRWLSSTDILKAATIDGARSAMLERDRSLEVGKKTDLSSRPPASHGR